MITVSEFVEAMREVWAAPDEEGGCENVENEALIKTWEQIGSVLINKTFKESKAIDKWDILSPPTGSGKSVGIAVFGALLSKLPPDQHPGLLVVTRRMEDADRIAAKTNLLARKRYGAESEVAASYHSDNRDSRCVMSLRDVPVLVVTHEAFTRALDPLKKTSIPWEDLSAFQDTRKRSGIVVDESLNLIDTHQINSEDLRKLLALIPAKVRSEFKDEIDLIEGLLKAMEMWEELEIREDMMVAKKGIRELYPQLPPTDLLKLLDALKQTKLDRFFKRRNESTKKDSLAFAEETLAAVDAVVNGFRWHKRKEGVHTYNTARLLIPDDAPGVVQMDATAVSNTIYNIFDLANPIPVIEGTRSYANVTLHASFNHRVGKRFMGENADELCRELMANLEQHPAVQGKNVLIVTHLDVEPVLDSYTPANFSLKTAHWGAIDGSNDWKDCEVVVLFGLQYRPEEWQSNTFFSLQGPQDSDWMRPGADRSFRGHLDIREAILTGQLTSDAIQAASRGCCRKVMDDQGNCPPMDLFVLYPRGEEGTAIHSGIVRAMPGVKTTGWQYEAQKASLTRDNHEAALVKYLTNMRPGEVKATRVREELGIPLRTFRRLLARLQGTTPADSSFRLAVSQTGVSYVLKRKGKGQTRAYFEKRP